MPNGEGNRDGANDNRSWNCGVEGPSDDPEIEALRNRQVKNFLTVTLLSLGVPMIVMGDEVRRSQLGNNNAYCQDNETSWFDWTLLEKHADLHRFVKLLIARRLLRDLDAGHQRTTLNELLHSATRAWHGVKLLQPDWSSWSHSLAFSADLPNEPISFHLIMNAYWEPLDFELPPEGMDGPWRRWIDTLLALAGRHRGLARSAARCRWNLSCRPPLSSDSAQGTNPLVGQAILPAAGFQAAGHTRTPAPLTSHTAPVSPHSLCDISP